MYKSKLMDWLMDWWLIDWLSANIPSDCRRQTGPVGSSRSSTLLSLTPPPASRRVGGVLAGPLMEGWKRTFWWEKREGTTERSIPPSGGGVSPGLGLRGMQRPLRPSLLRFVPSDSGKLIAPRWDVWEDGEKREAEQETGDEEIQTGSFHGWSTTVTRVQRRNWMETGDLDGV